MPKEFDKCISSGGRVRTKKVNEQEYMHICFAKSGKSVAGEVKKKKKG